MTDSPSLQGTGADELAQLMARVQQLQIELGKARAEIEVGDKALRFACERAEVAANERDEARRQRDEALATVKLLDDRVAYLNRLLNGLTAA